MASAISVGNRSIMSLKLSEPPSRSVPRIASSSLETPEDDLWARLLDELRWEFGKDDPPASRLSSEGKFAPETSPLEPMMEDCLVDDSCWDRDRLGKDGGYGRVEVGLAVVEVPIGDICWRKGGSGRAELEEAVLIPGGRPGGGRGRGKGRFGCGKGVNDAGNGRGGVGCCLGSMAFITMKSMFASLLSSNSELRMQNLATSEGLVKRPLMP